MEGEPSTHISPSLIIVPRKLPSPRIVSLGSSPPAAEEAEEAEEADAAEAEAMVAAAEEAEGEAAEAAAKEAEGEAAEAEAEATVAAAQ